MPPPPHAILSEEPTSNTLTEGVTKIHPGHQVSPDQACVALRGLRHLISPSPPLPPLGTLFLRPASGEEGAHRTARPGRTGQLLGTFPASSCAPPCTPDVPAESAHHTGAVLLQSCVPAVSPATAEPMPSSAPGPVGPTPGCPAEPLGEHFKLTDAQAAPNSLPWASAFSTVP